MASITSSGVQPPGLAGDEVIQTNAPRGTTTVQAIAQYAGAQASYMGNIATHCSVPSFITNGGGAIITNSRSNHIACDDITVMMIAIPNWYAASGGEFAAGAAATCTAAVEYPVGTIQQITFAGVAAGTVADGGTLISDAAVITIPKGAMFFIRIWRSCSAGIMAADVTGGNTDGYEFGGAGTADKTLSGSIAINGSDFFTPAAIIANTRVASALLIGDSKMLGLNDQTNQQQNDIGEGARGLGKACIPYINLGASSDLAGFTFTRRAALQQYCTHVLCNYGINNLAAGNTLLQLLSNLAITYAYFPTKPIFQFTLAPYTPASAGSSNWTSFAGQSTAAFESIRKAFNTQARTTGITGTAGVIDVAQFVETGTGGGTNPVANGGAWMYDGTTIGAYTSDGIHESPIAAERIMTIFPAGLISR